MKSAAAISRRSVLGLAALTLAGCKHGSSATATSVDPDAPALAAARDSELALINAIGLAPNLGLSSSEAAQIQAQRDLHLAHLRALGGSTTMPTASSSTSPSPVEGAGPATLKSSAASLRAAAVAAVEGAHAALFSSIAASHEVSSHQALNHD